jgi:exosome complex RNA-binding protein Rrp42 (RNase PH superfamily)
VTISSDTGALEEHAPELREPLPLALHHLPVIVSFAFFDNVGELVVQDPTADEEEAAQGVMTVRLLALAMRSAPSMHVCRAHLVVADVVRR